MATDKTIKTGSDGFDGSRLGKSPKIEAPPKPEPTDRDLARATALLNRTGCRIMRPEGGDVIGVWSDLDSPAIRHSLRILGMDELQVRYLDGPGVPMKFKLRRVTGEPVTEYVRLAMERHPDPWKAREQILGRAWRFEPWLLPAEAKQHTIDPRTGIRPISEWGASCGRGFVSNSRFGKNQPVIPRTNRKRTRKWRQLND
jgi:hypothetical protein